MVAIKQLGTNGGGFYGANSAHPLENPNYFTNIVENICIILIPDCNGFCIGLYNQKEKICLDGIWCNDDWIFTVTAFNSVYNEMHGNPMIAKMGISQPLGSMEGKEVRFGLLHLPIGE